MPNYKCYCGAVIEFEFEDGYTECMRCDTEIELPGCQETLDKFNKQTDEMLEEARYTGRIIIMRIDECMEARHVITLTAEQVAMDNSIVDLTIAGAKERYPEAYDVYSVREDNNRFLAEQFLLDEGIH